MNKQELEEKIQKAIMEYQSEHKDRVVARINIETHSTIGGTGYSVVECVIEVKE